MHPPTIADGAKGVVDFVRDRAGTALSYNANHLDVCIVGSASAISQL